MNDEPTLDEELLVVSDWADENGCSRAAEYIRDIVAKAKRQADLTEFRASLARLRREWDRADRIRQERLQQAYAGLSTETTNRRGLRYATTQEVSRVIDVEDPRFVDMLSRFDRENAERASRPTIYERFKRSFLSTLGVDQPTE